MSKGSFINYIPMCGEKLKFFTKLKYYQNNCSVLVIVTAVNYIKVILIVIVTTVIFLKSIVITIAFENLLAV